MRLETVVRICQNAEDAHPFSEAATHNIYSRDPSVSIRGHRWKPLSGCSTE
jgi:hypothetical protein